MLALRKNIRCELDTMENCESQSKDAEVITIVEDPFASPIVVERALMDVEVCSLLDILYEIWIPSKSAIRNLKSMMGVVQSYMMNQRKVDPTTRRMQEAKMIKDALIQILKLWNKLCPLSPTCSKEEIINFLRTHKLYAMFAEDVITQDTYFEWIHDFKEYIRSRPLSSSSSDVSVQCAMEHAPECVEMKSDGGGLNALFDLPMSHQRNDVVSQHISKPENGRLFTLKSPGEKGHQLIRLDVYDVKDILSKDKRQWWKYAKVRSQFLISSNVDPKQQLVQQLLDRAADDLKKVAGVRKEINDIAYHSG